MVLLLSNQLELNRCPHCGVDRPNITALHQFATIDSEGNNKRVWMVYACKRCGGLVVASSRQIGQNILEIFPEERSPDESIPHRPREYLSQALSSKSAPSGAVMLAASAVDAMLKEKGYMDGSLNSRIIKAQADHLITEDMAKWAHEVRLEANGERHADYLAELPTIEDAERVIDFATALAQFLFVLPARVTRGLSDATKKS